MKDYRLSEIKEICEKQEDCKDCPFVTLCMENLLALLNEDDIEPRDMIELPSVQKYEWKYEESSRNHVSYDVIYRDYYGKIQIFSDFPEEKKAYAFLSSKKRSK